MKNFDYTNFRIFIEKNPITKILMKIKYFFERSIWFLKRMKKISSLIWKTYDFDSSYAIEYFIFQLENTATFLESDKAYTVSAKYNAGRIRTTVKLLRRILEDYYEMKYFEEVNKKYNRNFKFVPYENEEGYSTLKWVYREGDDPKEVDKAYSEALIKGTEIQEKANRIVWKMIERDIWTWWD